MDRAKPSIHTRQTIPLVKDTGWGKKFIIQNTKSNIHHPGGDMPQPKLCLWGRPRPADPHFPEKYTTHTPGWGECIGSSNGLVQTDAHPYCEPQNRCRHVAIPIPSPRCLGTNQSDPNGARVFFSAQGDALGTTCIHNPAKPCCFFVDEKVTISPGCVRGVGLGLSSRLPKPKSRQKFRGVLHALLGCENVFESQFQSYPPGA